MASVVLGLALIITVAKCQVQWPCDSPLRPIPSLAIFFEHCNSLCHYNEWIVTPYVDAVPTVVSQYQCRSELALLGERLQTPINLYECTETVCETCETRRQQGFICVSTCRYSDWTELIPLSTATPVQVPVSQCLSGLSITVERWQHVISGYECTGTVCDECQDHREVSYICNITCRYSDWTEATPLVNATPIAVPYEQCPSEKAILGERWQRAITSGYQCTQTQCQECQDRRGEIHLCGYYV